MNQKPLREGDVYPSHRLRDQYGMNAENRSYFTIAEHEVPDLLREVIPFAERWAISCDVTRGDYFSKQPEEEIADFYYKVVPFIGQIHDWLDKQPENVGDWPDAAIHFLSLLKAHADAYQPTEEDLERQARRQAEWEHKQRRIAAFHEAEEAFKSKDYSRVVNLLTPYSEELDRIQSAKLALAEKRQ